MPLTKQQDAQLVARAAVHSVPPAVYLRELVADALEHEEFAMKLAESLGEGPLPADGEQGFRTLLIHAQIARLRALELANRLRALRQGPPSK